MSRSGSRGRAAGVRLSLFLLAGLSIGAELGCQRTAPPNGPKEVVKKEAASSPQVTTGMAQSASFEAEASLSEAQKSNQASPPPAAQWVKEPDEQPGTSPAVPSGWIIPEESPQPAPSSEAKGDALWGRPGTPSGESGSSSIEPQGKTEIGTPVSQVPGPIAETSQGTKSEESAPDMLPNPLRGGRRPAPELQGLKKQELPRLGELTPVDSGTSIARTQATGTERTGTSRVFQRRLERPPFDPIKENGEFFVGWTKPQVALVFTGRQDGYFEPCGCAGKERMKGGLSRRHTMIRQLREQGWPVVVLDVGGLIKGFGKQTEVKFQITVDALRAIGYDAINLGRNDLRLPAPLLLSAIAPVGHQTSEFVSANVALFDFASDQWTSRYRIVEAGGKRVGITAILGKSYHEDIRNPDLAFKNPEEALGEILPQLKSQADILVLLAYATDEEAFALVKKFPEFTVLATSDGPAEPPGSPQFVPDTNTLLVHVGEKGMAAVVLGFYDNPHGSVAYQRVILDSRYPDSPEMKQMMVTYQSQLEALGLAGLEIRPIAHPRREIQGDYVGSDKCANCHEKSYFIWKKSGHAKAWDTLKQLDPPRTFDPECISCHVTGWHPTRYFPYLSGFLSERETPHLIDVGCESCHGPGGEHVAAEMGSDIERQRRAAQAMIVTKEQAENSEVHNCRNCHDLDNSPDFDFAKYWPLVEHYEKE